MSNFNASIINVNNLNVSKFNTGSIIGTIDELIITSDSKFSINIQNLITKITCNKNGTSYIIIENGIPGQLKIIILVYGSSMQINFTPVTRSGFHDVQFNNIGDTLTLIFIDDVVGWVIQSSYGCIVNVL